MLNLWRRVDQSIYIGNNIKITVVAIDRNRVKVGIEAPHDVEVHREEVFERIKREANGAATEPDDEHEVG